MVQLQLQLGIDDAILDASAEEIADALAGVSTSPATRSAQDCVTRDCPPRVNDSA